MHGLKLFGITALAANKGALESNLNSAMKSVGTPMTVEEPSSGRRQAFQALFWGTAAVAAPAVSVALDMDAFMNAELESDKKNCNPKLDPKCAPKLSADEAMCQYGQSGDARGEACKRVKAAGGKMPSVKKEKSLGGAYAM